MPIVANSAPIARASTLGAYCVKLATRRTSQPVRASPSTHLNHRTKTAQTAQSPPQIFGEFGGASRPLRAGGKRGLGHHSQSAVEGGVVIRSQRPLAQGMKATVLSWPLATQSISTSGRPTATRHPIVVRAGRRFFGKEALIGVR